MFLEFIICLDENNEANKLEGVVLDKFLKLKEEGVLAKHVKRMEGRFSNMQCLIHTDLYSSSIMKRDDQIRVSSEALFLGPVFPRWHVYLPLQMCWESAEGIILPYLYIITYIEDCKDISN